jgi:hypothetical protein
MVVDWGKQKSSIVIFAGVIRMRCGEGMQEECHFSGKVKGEIIIQNDSENNKDDHKSWRKNDNIEKTIKLNLKIIAIM